MYLNWNPSLFSHRRDYNFSWDIPSKIYREVLSKNPQFAVASSTPGTVWIVVSRHFADAELKLARSGIQGSTAAASRQLGFMSLSIFDNVGHRVHTRGEELYHGPYVDSPQTLVRLEAKPNRQYTVVLDQHELPLPSYSFTMLLFSHCPLTVAEASEAMPCVVEEKGAWTRRTAGGNSSCATYFQNPQYKLSVNRATPVSILLSADLSEIHVHVDIVWAQGNRVTSVRLKDLVASSGEYRRGCAVADIPLLEPGTYTLVCSTFDAGQVAGFALRLASKTAISVTPVPADGAGRLLGKLPRLLMTEGEEKYRVPVDASCLTRATVNMQAVSIPQDGGRTGPPASLMVRVSVVHGHGLGQAVIAVSGQNEFRDPMVPIRTPQFDMEPGRIGAEGLWVLVESIGSHNMAVAMEGHIFSDSPVRVGTWEPI
ncbi:hypothetical protein UVI_02048220 [Ustilaginoidea virens]|nr:hypothetical protein UVI_02048220 [Ustilaginoidea virens]